MKTVKEVRDIVYGKGGPYTWFKPYKSVYGIKEAEIDSTEYINKILKFLDVYISEGSGDVELQGLSDIKKEGSILCTYFYTISDSPNGHISFII